MLKVDGNTWIVLEIYDCALVKRTRAFVVSLLHEIKLNIIIEQAAYVAIFYGIPKIHMKSYC